MNKYKRKKSIQRSPKTITVGQGQRRGGEKTVFERTLCTADIGIRGKSLATQQYLDTISSHAIHIVKRVIKESNRPRI